MRSNCDAFELSGHLQSAFKSLKRLGLSITGAYFNADAAFDTRAARKVCFNHHLIPNIAENVRNRKRTKPGPKRWFNPSIYKLRACAERSCAWMDKFRACAERSCAWMDKFRALLIRFDRRARYFLGSHFIAFAMINLRDLVNSDWFQRVLQKGGNKAMKELEIILHRQSNAHRADHRVRHLKAISLLCVLTGAIAACATPAPPPAVPTGVAPTEVAAPTEATPTAATEAMLAGDAQRGQYLANIFGCVDCHSVREADGMHLAQATLLAGGEPFPGPWGLVHSANVTQIAPETPPDELEKMIRGQLLVLMGGCHDCHTPRDAQGQFDMSRMLAGGGAEFPSPNDTKVIPPNITPDKETGIGDWTDEQIIAALREGKARDGHQLNPIMPYASAYHAYTDDDVAAVVAFLRSIAPIKNEIPPNPVWKPAP